ncbi:MAG: glycosyltransferase [Armatimonadetes bacterium]|nr:glycosyltransferase [Candidatus Hippobium faecium]
MKKKLLFTMYDMNMNGAVLCLCDLLKLLDYSRFKAEIIVLKEYDPQVISMLPPEVKVSYIFRDNPYFDIGFLKGLKKCLKEKKKEYISALIVNTLFRYINTKHISKLKNSMRRVYVPEEKYDTAISFDEQSFRYLKKINSDRKIVCYHYGEVCTMEDPDNKPYNFCDYVVAQCSQLKKDLAYKNKADEDKIKVIHNFFDNENIKTKSEEFTVPKDTEYIFSTCGRIIPLKRIDLIPLAAKILIDKGITDFKWYVIGYPEKEKYMAPIMENIKKTGTENHIVFTGKQMNPFPYIKASHIYVQTSNIDAWPRTVMEAMILGVPVLCTKTMGGQEQINPGVTGELCETDSAEDLAEKLIYMLNNYSIYNKDPKPVNNQEIMEEYYKIF